MFTDPAALIAAGGIDLAIILTPCATHRRIVEMAAAAGIDVFCEKPLALSISDGEAMIVACKAAGVQLFYGSCYRYALHAQCNARAALVETELVDMPMEQIETVRRWLQRTVDQAGMTEQTTE